MVHNAHLQAEDDGTIWIMCECGWTQSLGYAPRPEDTWTAKQEHLRSLDLPTMSPYGTLVLGGNTINWTPVDDYVEEPVDEHDV